MLLVFSSGDGERNLSVALITEMKKDGIVSNDKFVEALKEFMSSLPEKEPQIPRIHSFVAGKHCFTALDFTESYFLKFEYILTSIF